MTCAWKEVLSVLPPWIAQESEKMSPESVSEIRIREGFPIEYASKYGVNFGVRPAERKDIQYCMNAATRYSPWSAGSIADGYISINGGHRLGICGEAVWKDGQSGTMRQVNSICIRVAKDFPGISGNIAEILGSILILGPPGWGKTTLLRDLSRSIGREHTVCVVDQRGELFPNGIERGRRMDVLAGTSKAHGINRLLKTMGPEYIAVDEITAQEDTDAVLEAIGCGIFILATAHGSSVEDLRRRPIYRKLWDNHVFSTILLMNRDRSFRMEKMLWK